MPSFFTPEKTDTRFHYHFTPEDTSLPPLVFCHGLGGDLTQGNSILENQSTTTLAWDARLHGKTAPTSITTSPTNSDQSLSFETFSTDLKKLLTHLDLTPNSKITLIGISMGSGVALRFALDHPDSVHSLILIRPAWLDAPSPPNLHCLHTLAEKLRTHSSENTEPLQNHIAENPDFQKIHTHSPAVYHSLLKQIERPEAITRSTVITSLIEDAPVKSLQELHRITPKTLIIGNEPDWMHPFEIAQTWSQHIPNNQLIKIPSKSTSPQQHESEQRQAIDNFLKST